jgi:membrane-associated phospholipid phosphatase
MQKASIILLNILLIGQISFAQQNTESAPWKLKNEIVPLALIGVGSLLLLTDLDFYLQENIYKTTTASDDFMQFVPIVGMYGLDLFHVPSANNAFVQTKYFAAASLSNAIVIHSIKRLSNRTRPDGTSYAFPSGHTSQAFVSATVFWQEFKDSNPILALSGYAVATTTGILRMTNNKHWFTDVVVGAGIGILVTDLIYAIKPLKNWEGIKLGKSSLLPQIGQMGEATVASLKFQF